MVDTGLRRRPAQERRSTSTSASAIDRLGESVIRERYGNLFDMYERITDENPYQVPMRIYPAIHYTMGGLWVDYNLMTTVPGLYAIGEANFADHGANRLGASALMQGLADGYFVLPYTIGDYLAGLLGQPPVPTDDPEFTTAEADARRPTSTGGCRSAAPSRSTTTTASSARSCGTTAAWPATRPASRRPWPRSRRCATSSARTCGCSARPTTVNQSLEKVQRVADFFELAELMCRDALHPRGELRRPLPGRAPDRRGRGPARRRALRLRRRLGVAGPEHAPGAPQGAPRVRVRPPHPEELQVTPDRERLTT